MFDAMVVVACCAGVGITLSILTLGSSSLLLGERKGRKEEEKERRPNTSSSSSGSSSSSCSSCGGGSSSSSSRVLIVTAHPDDEVMFFGPTISHFIMQEGTCLHLLCMSNGNYYKQGKVRTRELLSSCEILGLQRSNVMVYSCDSLPDCPDASWPVTQLARIINQRAHQLGIDVIITFDSHGVSGHPNHCSLFYALNYLVQKSLLPPKCVPYSLDSVGVLRKYSGFLDIPISLSLSECVFTVTRKQHLIIQNAMRAHHSQYMWFRRLYMIFSRYVLVNTLSRITVQESKDD